MAPYENETVVWKENYFMNTLNIYEPRGPKYQCTECNEVFNTRLSIFTHSKMHLKPFCVVCGIYTQNTKEMQNHMKCNHISMIEIIPTKASGNTSRRNSSNNLQISEKGEKALNKKQKVHSSKKTTPVANAQTKNDKHSTKCVVSRFGRCINVKIPDF